MKKTHNWLLIGLMLSFGQSPAIAQSREHVLVESVKAQIRRAGSDGFQTMSPGSFLSGGDELKVASGGKVTVICRNGTEAKFSAMAQLQKISSKCQSAATQVTSERSFWRVVLDWFQGKPLPASIADSRGGLADIPYVIAPRKSMVLTARPEIHWNLVAKAESYEISLNHPEFETISWTVDAANLQYQYPLNQPELVAGEKYILKIKTNNFVSSTEDGQTVWVAVLGTDKQQELFGLLEQLRQQDLPEPTEIIFESALYEKFELYGQAITILEGFIRNQSPSVAVYQRLAEVYETIDLPREEEMQYQQIMAMTKGELSEVRAIALTRLAAFAEADKKFAMAQKYRAESQQICQQLGCEVPSP